jgi:sugar phosphate isomerase/epimerase
MRSDFSRRSFLALTAAAPLARAVPQAGKRLPIGLELYSVRTELAKDLTGTVSAVAKMGYEVVEFFSPYYQWTTDQAKDVRKLMDGLGIRCNSTHNDYGNLGAGLPKALELNNILGTKYIVMASSPRATTVDAYKNIATVLTAASEKAKAAGLRVGYHNHDTEFQPVEGTFGMAVLAANTPKEVMLQFDVGTCVQVGHDPLAWIESNPGRINSMHLKDWGAGADRGARVLFGEGDAPWLRIFAAGEKTGGVEYYLIEQEGTGGKYPELETARRCLANYQKLRGYA